MDDAALDKLIDTKIAKAMAFATKKYGDTPTDAYQLVPKKYVTSVLGTVGVPGGTDGDVQFNSGGQFSGNDNFKFSQDGGIGVIRVILGSQSIDQAVVISTPSIVGASVIGGSLGLVSGDSTGPGGVAGGVAVTVGQSNSNISAGNLTLKAGANNGAAPAGNVLITGGTALGTSSVAGDVVIRPGQSGTTVDDGNVLILPFSSSTTKNGGFLVFPVISGTPTGVPVNTGSFVYDSSANKLWVYNGSWRSVAVT